MANLVIKTRSEFNLMKSSRLLPCSAVIKTRYVYARRGWSVEGVAYMLVSTQGVVLIINTITQSSSECTERGVVKKKRENVRKKSRDSSGDKRGGERRRQREARGGARCYQGIALLRTHTEAAIQCPDPASIAPATGPHFQSRCETKDGL